MPSCRGPIINLGRALVLAVALSLPLLRAATIEAALSGVPSVSDPRYFVGANVPWFNWACDFGCGDNGGAHSPVARAALSDGFGRLKTAGVHTVRWWTFEGDPWQITRDSSGSPTGLNPAVYVDFDAALALADQYDLVYDFVLFSSPTAVPQTWITDPKQRQGLANALAPLFERYKNAPRILAWELFNEPEWDIWNSKIPQASVQATVKLLADTVHATTATAVTVGSATMEGLPLWADQGIDFYSPHWYDTMPSGAGCARCTDAATVRAAYKLDDRAIVLGEFYAGPDTDALQRFKDFRSKGYAGAWAWSLFSDKTNDKMRVDLGAIAPFISDPGVATSVAPVPSAAPPKVQLLASWVSPTYVSPGQTITFHQDARSTGETRVLVDFEVYNQSGDKISQTALDDQVLSTDGVTSLSTSVELSASLPPGQYLLKTGLFAPGWGTLYTWSDLAGTFVVEALSLPISIPASDSTDPG